MYDRLRQDERIVAKFGRMAWYWTAKHGYALVGSMVIFMHKLVMLTQPSCAVQVKEVLEAGPDEADLVGLSEFAKLEAQLSN